MYKLYQYPFSQHSRRVVFMGDKSDQAAIAHGIEQMVEDLS